MRKPLVMMLFLLSTTATAGEVVQVLTVSDYVARIHNRVTRFIYPARCESLGDTASGQVDIILLREGEVLNVSIRESSGSERCDEELKKAVLKAQRFQMPSDPEMFKQLHKLTLTLRPNDPRPAPLDRRPPSR